jgi:hypothetical protein
LYFFVGRPVYLTHCPGNLSKIGLRKLGIPEWLASKTACWSDRYFFVATKTLSGGILPKKY